MNKTENILFEKEIANLKILSYGRILFLSVFFFSTLTVTTNIEEKKFAFFSSLILILINLFNLKQLRSKKNLLLVGLGGICMDMLLISILPFIWYNSASASGDIPSAYYLKTSLTLISVSIIIIEGIALRPIYPFITSIYFSFLHLFFVIKIVNDPRTVFSQFWSEIILGPAVNVNLFYNNILIVLFTGLITSYICYSSRKITFEAVKLEVANSQLSRYFSPNVATEISTETLLLQPGGKIQKVTVLFTDIRNFTSISESKNPNEILQFLSEYHEIIVSKIFKYGGTLDKFIGDAVMATFGTPFPNEKDSLNAVLAAKEMSESLSQLNLERKARGLFEIKHGIGIHTGNALVGNIGTKDRLEYTVIGDVVNTANRIESMTKELEQEILFSKEVATEIESHIQYKEVGKVKMKGKSEEIILYSI